MPSDQRAKTIRLLRLLVKEQPLPVEKAAEAFAGPIEKENFDADDRIRKNRQYCANLSEDYAYHPCPMKSPPIPTNIFLHHLSRRSASVHRRLMWAKCMPQKLERSILQGQSGDALVVDWGVHIFEGLDRFTSLAIMLVMLLLSGVVSIVWTVTQDDVQSGFGIRAWMTSVQAVVTMMVLAKWR